MSNVKNKLMNNLSKRVSEDSKYMAWVIDKYEKKFDVQIEEVLGISKLNVTRLKLCLYPDTREGIEKIASYVGVTPDVLQLIMDDYGDDHICESCGNKYSKVCKHCSQNIVLELSDGRVIQGTLPAFCNKALTVTIKSIKFTPAKQLGEGLKWE